MKLAGLKFKYWRSEWRVVEALGCYYDAHGLLCDLKGDDALSAALSCYCADYGKDVNIRTTKQGIEVLEKFYRICK